MKVAQGDTVAHPRHPLGPLKAALRSAPRLTSREGLFLDGCPASQLRTGIQVHRQVQSSAIKCILRRHYHKHLTIEIFGSIPISGVFPGLVALLHMLFLHTNFVDDFGFSVASTPRVQVPADRRSCAT